MMTGFERYTKKTRRAMFLEEMEQVVPWEELCALVEPHYPKPGSGRRPKELEQMLRPTSALMMAKLAALRALSWVCVLPRFGPADWASAFGVVFAAEFVPETAVRGLSRHGSSYSDRD
jgi:hypothetical protein